MQKLLQPHATRLSDLVSNRGEPTGSGDVYLGLCQRKVPETQWKVCKPDLGLANKRLMFMKKSLSVRAWRCVRFNKKYAEKLERKAARKKEQERKVEKPPGPKPNPFSVSPYSDSNHYALTSFFSSGILRKPLHRLVSALGSSALRRKKSPSRLNRNSKTIAILTPVTTLKIVRTLWMKRRMN